jgi:hypothetical protein
VVATTRLGPSMVSSRNYAAHTPYSDPGSYADLLQALPTDLEALCATSRNVIAHYWAELPDLPPERRGEIDSRWLRTILELDQDRNPFPLAEPRPLQARVAGCCRDHSLFLVGALREQRVPARTRVGFASYLSADYHNDHVVVEFWNGDRWVRTDPELPARSRDFDVRDMPVGPGAPFETAAEVWTRHRAGEIDASTYGVSPRSELAGPDFIGRYVVFEVAHRFGDELLLWDGWGAADGGDVGLFDEIAALLIGADAGDEAAATELARRYRDDDRLHPGESVTQHSPYGKPPVTVRLDPPG